MKLTLVHLEGSKQGLTESLTGAVITVGRDPSNVLSFDPFKDLDVSSRHASISVQGDQAVLQDLGSTNGTFLNGSKVNGAVPLPNGCMIQFGENGPKVQATWSLDEGPGKKTKMIHDLRATLDEEGLKRGKAKKRNVIIIALVLLLGVGVAVGLMIKSSSDRAADLLADMEREKTKAGREKAAAEELGAVSNAKGEWSAGLEAMTAAATAEEAGESQTALDKYREAIDTFQRAGRVAGTAALEKLKSQLAEASKQAEQSLEDKQAKDRADRTKLDEQNKSMLSAIRSELEAARKAQDVMKALDRLDTSDPKQLDQAIESTEKALADMPADSPERKELEAKLAEMKKKKEELGNVSEKLQAAAKVAKPMILMVRSHVFALPKGQRKDTTKIRVKVAESIGTGFMASADGKVVTAKEVVYPELFDPKAAALKSKLDERGMSFFRDIEVWAPKAGVYEATYGADKVSVARKFDDALGGKQTVTIPFDNSDVEVTVRVHERGDSDVVVLKLEGVSDAPFLELSGADVKSGLPLVALGTQKNDEGKPALFMFEGKVKEGERVLTLEVPSFNSWIGGPLLNSDGKVFGILISEDLKESKGAAASVFKPALE